MRNFHQLLKSSYFTKIRSHRETGIKHKHRKNVFKYNTIEYFIYNYIQYSTLFISVQIYNSYPATRPHFYYRKHLSEKQKLQRVKSEIP